MVYIHLLLLMSTLVSVQVINIAASVAAAGNGRAALQDLAWGEAQLTAEIMVPARCWYQAVINLLRDPGEL